MAKKYIMGTGAKERAEAVRLAADLGLPIPAGFTVGRDGSVSINPEAAADTDPDYMMKLIQTRTLVHICAYIERLEKWMRIIGIIIIVIIALFLLILI